MTTMLEAHGPYWLKGLLKSQTLLLWVSNTMDTYTILLDEEELSWRNTEFVTATIVELEFLAGLLQCLSKLLFDDELLWWAENLDDAPDAGHVLDLCIQAVQIVAMAKTVLEGEALHDHMEATDKINVNFPAFAGRIAACYLYILDEFTVSDMPKLIQENIQHSMTTQANPLMSMISCGFGSQWRGRCFGPGCLKMVQELARIFAVCSHCKHASYYSTKCQRNGWKYQDAPHRRACDLARRIKLKQQQVSGPAELLGAITGEIIHHIASEAACIFTNLHESQFQKLCESYARSTDKT
jgi:hypothetical protein